MSDDPASHDYFMQELQAEIDSLRKQRDEARREACRAWEFILGREKERVAEDQGWDCFNNLSESA